MSSSNIGLYQQRLGGQPLVKTWKFDGWRKGKNNYAEDNEIRDDEFYEGTNIEIVGKSSIQMPRRGSTEFASIVGKINFNGWGTIKNPKDGTNLLLSMWDGRLYATTTAGVSTEIDNTKTWDDEAKMRGVQLRESFYFGNGIDYMAKTDGTTVTRWTAITAPTLTSVVLTGSGTTTLYTYVVTAVAEGETESSNEVTAYGPSVLSTTNYLTLTFPRKTDSNIRGYNIWRSTNAGTLLLLDFLDQQAAGANMTYVDNGVATASLIYEAPTFNTTGGVKGNIYGKYANTLFVSGNDQEPDAVFYGGTGALYESFSPDANGGWIKPGRGDGERVTAMIGFEDFLFIFKENSIWKFIFGSGGAPELIAVIPQYGTSSPDTVWRFEKDIMYLRSDSRIGILGYEPTQLNVIRTTEISNRTQPDIDAWDKTNVENFFAVVHDQKYILCNGSEAIPYDRRYTGFAGKWTNYDYQGFISWDRGTKTSKLFGAATGGVMEELLVDNVYDDTGTAIPSTFRPKRIDGGNDTLLKFSYFSKLKLKNAKGYATLLTYIDGDTLFDTSNIEFSTLGGIGEYMFDEPMFDESVAILEVSDQVKIITKLLYQENYSYYHQLSVLGSADNHLILQTMNGVFEVENYDYFRDDVIL